MSHAAGSTDALIESALSDQPGLLAALTRLHESALDAVDSDLLELCRQRVTVLLGSEPLRSGPASISSGPASMSSSMSTSQPSLATQTERACLDFTDQFVTDVASMTDEVVEAVRTQLGDDGLLNFTNALLVVEQRQRFHLAISRLLPECAA
jgi:hypothetical protein